MSLACAHGAARTAGCRAAQRRALPTQRETLVRRAWARHLLRSAMLVLTAHLAGGRNVQVSAAQPQQPFSSLPWTGQRFRSLPWSDHEVNLAAWQRRQDSNTPKGTQDGAAGPQPPDNPDGSKCIKALYTYPVTERVNATCVGFQATVSVCAKNDKEAQAMVDKMQREVDLNKTSHGCEAFFWDYCYSIIGPAREERPFPKFDMVIQGCASKQHETSRGTKNEPQAASDAIRNYCDAHRHLSQCNTNEQCKPLEKRNDDWETFKVLRGCKGYDWFCENVEPKIVRAWEVHGLCTTKCKKETWKTNVGDEKVKILAWRGSEGALGCSRGGRLQTSNTLVIFACWILALSSTFSAS